MPDDGSRTTDLCRVLIAVTYDDAANGITDVQGNVTDLEAFCRAIEQGRIKNVRVESAHVE